MKLRYSAGIALFILAAINAAGAADLLTKAPVKTDISAWGWTGFYFGAHVGGGSGAMNFADPFGQSIYGDKVSTPAFLGGGQAGYNWQEPGTSWVLGLAGDLSLLASEGSNTCFAPAADAIASSCQVRPRATGTLTGRLGYAVGPSGRTLLYGKGGAAWVRDRVDMATDNQFNGELFVGHTIGPVVTGNSTTYTTWGWTLGVGVEQALTPSWSLTAEYDYLGFPSRTIANLGSVTATMSSTLTFGQITSVAPPGTSGVTQHLQEVKLGLNYHWDSGYSAAGWSTASFPALFGAPTQASGWEFEGGTRYMVGEGKFQKNLGPPIGQGSPAPTDISRLTYSGLLSSSEEVFGRIDSPWHTFVKGYVGVGSLGDGRLFDEDFGNNIQNTYSPYSNTLSSNVAGKISYAAVDAGRDFMEGKDYKLGAFAGYFYLNQVMDAFGCIPLAGVNCNPSVPISGGPVISENARWHALRIGLAGETGLTDRLKLSGDIAYLPYVWFVGDDIHFYGNSGFIAELFAEHGHGGQGVQIEGLASYSVTPQFSLGVGGRYWAGWVHGQFDIPLLPTFTPPQPSLPNPPHLFAGSFEEAGVFFQAAYRLGGPDEFASAAPLFAGNPFADTKAAATLAAAINAVTGNAADLARLNAAILKRPKDTALNLHYAALAEKLGETRLALAAYERVLIYDPTNAQAQAGIDRVRGEVQPETTRYVLETGTGYESNPRYVMPGLTTAEGQLLANLNVRDERFVGDTRFRTIVSSNLLLHGDDHDDLNYGYLGAATGPVVEFIPGVQVNPAIGGAAAVFDHKLFYEEATAGATFEAYPAGAYQMVQVRAGFRGYNEDFYPGGQGGYVEATSRFTLPTALADTGFTLSPWVRWSAIAGPKANALLLPSDQPGDYTEAGARFDVAHSFTDWMIGGVNFAVSERFYRDDAVAAGTDQRRDTQVAPGATIVFPHLITYNGDLRFDYRFLWNLSNDPTQTFVDHLITAKTIFRF
jgi:opacity protein-like surface antigen